MRPSSYREIVKASVVVGSSLLLPLSSPLIDYGKNMYIPYIDYILRQPCNTHSFLGRHPRTTGGFLGTRIAELFIDSIVYVIQGVTCVRVLLEMVFSM